ncbi:MAG: hypothetical protein IKT43_00855 [Clostridia bacterium]|nr:hypothetical protein [Clostridia bacterium]
MKLELFSPNKEEIRCRLEEATRLLESAKSFSDVRRAFDLHAEQSRVVDSAFSRAMLRYQQDLTDEEAIASLMENSVTMQTYIRYAPFGKAIANSPFREEIVKTYGPALCLLFEAEARLAGVEEEKGCVPAGFDDLRQEYQMITSQIEYEYEGEPIGPADLFALIWNGNEEQVEKARKARTAGILAKSAEYDRLLCETLARAEEIREFYNLKSYYEYASRLAQMRFFYDEADILHLLSQVKEKLVPAYRRLKSEWSKELSRPTPKTHDVMQDMRTTTAAVSESARAYFDTLEQMGCVDCAPSDTKENGIAFQRFVADIGVAPLIACGSGSYIDLVNLMHEFGHSLQEKNIFDSDKNYLCMTVSPDIMEIFSHVMEATLLFSGEHVFDDAKAFCARYLENVFERILSCAACMEFEMYLFSAPHATAEERKAKYVQLYREYGQADGMDEDDLICGYYREPFFFLSHFLLFAYVFSWIHALELVRRLPEDPEGFYALLKGVHVDSSVLSYEQLVAKYGMHNVFREDVMDEFVSWVFEFLKQ